MPDILALVPESQAQTEPGIDESEHVRERREKGYQSKCRRVHTSVNDLAALVCFAC